MTDLTILCVSRCDPTAWPFLNAMARLATRLRAEFILAADGDIAWHSAAFFASEGAQLIRVHSRGYIESVLDKALEYCSRSYVLRLDDDETVSPAMDAWLAGGQYCKADHWKFPRAHFWVNTGSVLITPHLWPDWQTRLSVKAKAGGRTTVHAGSPFGGGQLAPVCIEHHKFLVKSHEERLRIARTYDDFHPGYGTGNMKPFSLPEDAYETARLVQYAYGDAEWTPTWEQTIHL